MYFVFINQKLLPKILENSCETISVTNGQKTT